VTNYFEHDLSCNYASDRLYHRVPKQFLYSDAYFGMHSHTCRPTLDLLVDHNYGNLMYVNTRPAMSFRITQLQSISNFEARLIGEILTAASIWFKIWGVVEPGQKNFDFSRQISEKFRFFQVISLKKIRIFKVNFRKIAISSGNFTKKNRFFQTNFQQNSIFQEI